jgi:hypothetical protein
MRLPNGERAIVDEAKVRNYLLSPEHPVGRFKATRFRRLGFNEANWQELQQALRRHAATGDASVDSTSTYGRKFRVRAMLQGPTGRSMSVISVWMVRSGEEVPRFVTAFPGGTE